MQDIRQLKVAIVHDWLVGGGAERVVLELHHLFPNAPIYTSYCSDEWRARLDNQVVTGYLQKWPFGRLRKFLPVLRIFWFLSLRLKDYDLVISSSGNGEAKGIRTSKRALHVCYCHTPTHFYWRHYAQYMREPGFGLCNPLVRLGLRLLVGPLRIWDKWAARRPDYFIANSSHIQSDIKRYYGRESVVIYPPVDTNRFAVRDTLPARQGYITAGRQVPYKRVDLIVKACNELGLPLTVLGGGPEHKRLRRLAGPTVKFMHQPSDADMTYAMQTARAFIFAAHEDFGITPIEAMAAGTPVIAYRAGGALDYIELGKTGAFFGRQTTASLVQALRAFDANAYDPSVVAAEAAQYSTEAFNGRMYHYLQQLYSERQSH